MKWIKIVARNCYPLQWSAGVNQIFEELRFKDVFFRIKGALLIKYKTPLGYLFHYSKNSMETNFGDYIKSIDRRALGALIEAEKKIEEGMKTEAEESFEDIIGIYKKYRQLYGIMVMGYDFVPTILKALEKTVGEEMFIKIEPYLVVPYKKTTIVKEHEEISKIKQMNLNGKRLKQEAEKLAKKFGFIHSEYKAKEWVADDYLDEIRNPSKKTDIQNDKEPLDEFNLDRYSKWLISLLGRCAYLFDEAKSALVRASWALRKTLSNLDFDEKIILSCTEKEFLSWLKNKTLPKQDVLKGRDKFYAILALNNELKEFSTQKDVKKIIEQENIKEFIQIKEKIDLIKGRVAYQGIVKGRAKIIYSQDEEDKLKEGEILVASNTTPELIRAMRRASAFVTDEGGLLCHAAIIAREFKIPCIVGTEIATKVIKDGDLIEVDANKGIVKIIKRK